MAIIGGALQENPFFVPPDEFLRELRVRSSPRVREELRLRRRQAASGELVELRSLMRDVVALSGLSVVWVGQPVQTAVENIADALLRTLRVDFVYICLPSAGGSEPALDVAFTRRGRAEPGRTREMGEVLAPWRQSDQHAGVA